jgi:predicted MFS family arabinose efflux permease
VGRKRVLVPALLVQVVSAGVFLASPALGWLLVARVVSGVAVGLTTATATAYLAELHLGARPDAPSSRRASAVATAANLGGIGFGPLVSGLLAQHVGAPLRTPYVVFTVALLVLAVLVAVAPETAVRPEPAPAWRPQRVSVPREARGQFAAATATGIAAFAVFGIFTSLAPAFLAGTLHQTSHAVAGAVAFAAFAAGAVAQVATGGSTTRTTLRTGVVALVPGLVLLVLGMWLPSLAVFVVGGVVTGGAAGLLFRGGLTTAAATAAPQARAEVLAGYFLGAYIGLSVPVVALGLATQRWAAKDVVLVFAVLVVVAVLVSVRAALARLHAPAAA